MRHHPLAEPRPNPPAPRAILRRPGRFAPPAAVIASALLLLTAAPAHAYTVAPDAGPTAGGTTVTLAGAGIPFTSIAVGQQHSLYLDATGRVWAAGLNTSGELGDGGATSARTLAPVALPAGVRVTSIAAARALPGTSYGVASDGTVWAWGSNASGQMGAGTAGANRTTPAAITSLPAMASVAAGALHAAGLTTTGTVWGWGDNTSGQAGHTGSSFAPSAVAGLPAGITAVSAGSSFSLALAPDGTVWAWGDDARGQLGRGTTGGTSSAPTAVVGLPPVVEIAAGGSFAMARTSDGRVFTWGDNGLGQLGTGTAGGMTGTPQQVTLPPAASIAAGGVAALAVLVDGTSRAWGGDISGQLGDNSATNRSTPVVPQLPAGSTVARVYGGANTSVWLLTSGVVALAGDNFQGMLGIGATANYLFVPTVAPLAVTGVTIGGTAASSVTRLGADLQATTPAHPSGVVDTVVTWTYGSTSVPLVAQGAFTFGTPPTLSGAAGDFLAGADVDYTYPSSGDEPPTVTVSAGALPPGLSLDGTGRLTGSPTAAGTFSFTVTASNGLGSASVDDTIVVTALLVATDPVSQTVYEGETAEFGASAQSLLAPFSVRWQSSDDGGTAWIDVAGATDATVTTPPTVLADDGTHFRAVFTNSAGSVSTNPAALTVLPALMIVTDPADATVDEGRAATFTASARSLRTLITPQAVQWQRSTDRGATWADIPDATSDTFETADTTAADTGALFRAVYTVGGAERATHAARLTVLSTPPSGRLAATGVSPLGEVAGLGAMLLALGAILLLRRRRQS